MLKGVNKRIVEINNTGNEYFEKAILFVKPEMEKLSHTQLTSQAESYLSTFGKRKKTTLAVVVGIALSLLLLVSAALVVALILI